MDANGDWKQDSPKQTLRCDDHRFYFRLRWMSSFSPYAASELLEMSDWILDPARAKPSNVLPAVELRRFEGSPR